jgi:sialate O-acetylesterase
MRKVLKWGFAVLLVLAPCILVAQVSLPGILGDGMVLQRDIPIHFWGTAKPAEEVTVTFRGERKSAEADGFGYWHVNMSPSNAGGPFDVVIEASNKIVLHDVLVGDVWVASGQSNMEFPMSRLKDSAIEIYAANHRQVRFLKVKRAYSEYPLSNISGHWELCTTESSRDSSAVAYYFAREIQEREKIPVGIIESYWGGTVLEAWTSGRALTSDASLMPVLAVRSKMMDDIPRTALVVKEEASLREQAKVKGLPEPLFPWRPEPYMWQPAALFNAMISPLTPYGIKGVIWYQGESNTMIERSPFYERLFPVLIRDWRDHWGQGDFPFLYVQIPNFNSSSSEDWATVREAQRKTLSIRNTAMAVTIDVGDPNDIHPTNKRDVGSRLALLARATVYGEHIEYSGPLFRQVTRESKGLRVSFDHAEGLRATGEVVKGFEIAGEDGKYQVANAVIQGSTIVLSNTIVVAPVSVRYGWSNNPDCNLFNRDQLPASPFQATLPALD